MTVPISGLILIVILLGFSSALFFKLLPLLNQGQQKKAVINYFVLFFFFTAIAYLSFIFSDFLNHLFSLSLNSMLYLSGFYCLWHGLVCRKYQQNYHLYKNKYFYINILFILWLGYVTRANPFIRILVFDINIVAILLACLPLIKNTSTHSRGEKIVKTTIYLCSLLVLIAPLPYFIISSMQAYTVTITALQALQINIWLGALSSLLISDSVDLFYHYSITDPMTALFNRRYFIDKIKKMMQQAAHNHSPAGVMITCDIDNFKSVNDKYGHDVGDKTIMAFAEVLQANVREQDTVARLGGEEFAIFLPYTSLAAAKQVAERMRQQTEQLQMVTDVGKLNFTASFGLTSFVHSYDIDTYLKTADRAMYRAKTSGKNLVCVYQ